MLYQHYLKSIHLAMVAPNMNELLLKKAHVLKDFAKLVVAITNYASRPLFMT
jgi:hypothetical protein